MNIALCCDDNFVKPALVCLTSIFENNKGEEIHAYILTDGISDESCEKIDKLSKAYARPIDIMEIDKHVFDGLRVSERFPVSIYYRFLLPKMLPDEDKVLYLDCDIIVRHSLHDFYITPLLDKAMTVVVGQSCDDIVITNKLQLKEKYFNSGVLLMNLAYWREHQITKQLIWWVADNADIAALPDQDALNKVLDGKVVFAPYTYNFQERWTRQSSDPYVHYSKWEDIRNAGRDPVVVHFCEAEKPWFVECKNPFQQEFIHYAQLQPFIDFHLQSRYGSFSWRLSKIIDRIGLKFRWWAECWQKNLIKNIKIG